MNSNNQLNSNNQIGNTYNIFQNIENNDDGTNDQIILNMIKSLLNINEILVEQNNNLQERVIKLETKLENL